MLLIIEKVMKYILIIGLFIIGYCSYSQESYYIKGKDYYGFVFSGEHSICGFPPEIIIGNVPIGSHRCTLTEENIIQAETILRNNINTEYVKSCQFLWKKPPINKRTLKKYYRQYIGYLTPNNEEIVRIYLIIKDFVPDIKRLSDDLIEVYDGGYCYWRISVNLQTQLVFDMEVNGES